jgi:CDP-diacylglycerol--serine O-phosphatidyltransferase
MKKIAVLPSMLTLGNLLCGVQALYFGSKGTQEGLLLGAWMIFAAMVFDALDGKVARLTRVSSRFGAELDSLADVVSFGVAPALLVGVLSAHVGVQHQRLVWVSCMVYAACAALRLARFNVQSDLDEGSHQAFVGLPSPAAAGQVASLIILDDYVQGHWETMVVARLLPAVTFFAGILMVSRIPYVHMVTRLLRSHHAFPEVAFLAVAVLLFVAYPEFALAGTFNLYVLAGLVVAARNAILRRAEDQEPIF